MSISSWIISIVGVCLISVMVDLCLSGGKTGIIIKNVMSYVIILIVIAPLPNLIKTNFSAEDIFSEIEISIQSDYIYSLNQQKVVSLKTNIEQALEAKDIYGAVVSVSSNIFDIDMQIEAIYVDLYNAVIPGKIENINIKTEVVSVVTSIIKIAEEKVIIYE